MTKFGIHLGGTARSGEDVKRLHSLGLEFAEIPITDPQKFSNLLKEYKDLKDRLDIYYLCHGPREGDPNDMTGLEEVYLPKIVETLPLMTELGMPLLTLHLWFDPRFVKEEVITFKIALLRHIIKKATDLEITVCVENLSETASHMVTPFTDLPLLNLTLDVGHAQLLAETNTSYEFIERYPDRIKHVHLHDNRGGDSALDDLHLLPGEGIVNFDRVFGKLKDMNYKRTITLELVPSEIAKCLRHVKEWLGRSGLE
jgi:sugar phosphate isomerase/epimerase